MLDAVLKISPRELRHKLSLRNYITGVVDGDWDVDCRVQLDMTDKHRSIVQHYVDGVPWPETEMFRNQYATRFSRGEMVRGTTSAKELAAQYDDRVDAMYRDLREHGFREFVDGRYVTIPDAYVGRDGEIMLGNNGNHRVAMAKVLDLPHVFVRIRAVHKMQEQARLVYPTLKQIPAMTTQEEREAYYLRTREGAPHGAVLELGAWLGASTAAIAAAVRDAGIPRQTVHVYDRFAWKPEHSRKAREFYGHDIESPGETVDALEEFRRNLGDLLPFVTVHKGEIRDLRWPKEKPIGFVLFDAPKRVPEISRALTELSGALNRGSIMAWQDFAYFPSYEIPACISRLTQSGHVKLVEGIYPGTTAILKVSKPWRPDRVSATALALESWTEDEIVQTWGEWSAQLPEPMRPRFECGAAMFLCDVGAHARARRTLRGVVDRSGDAVMPKWEYLRKYRTGLMQRYAALATELWG